MNKKVKFNCGCEFNVIDGKFIFDTENVPLSCDATWDLISDGNTKGIFQLENQLGQMLAKKLKPRNIEHLAALTAIIRPSCLEAKISDSKGNFKTITNRYIDRKNNNEVPECFHPALEPILKNNYNLMIYQEDAIKIARDIAGFSLEKADSLRKACAKKQPELMVKVKKQFLQGCSKVGAVDREDAEEIFSWIEKSQRYSFNKCLSPNTTVKDNKANIYTLRGIEIGQYIKTPEGFCQVLNKYYNGPQELFAVKLELNKTINCTINHKFMCEDKSIKPLWEILYDRTKIFTEDGFAKIIGIQSIGTFEYLKHPTIDIEVDNESHTFFANGIATSNSHAVGYAMNSYLSSYAKVHFQKLFYWSYLSDAKHKVKPSLEVYQLVNNAKANDVEIHGPNFFKGNSDFEIIDGEIYFGLANIKGIGESIVKKIVQQTGNYCVLHDKKITDIEWNNFLLYLSPTFNSRAVAHMVESGALDGMEKSRNEKLYEYHLYMKLTKKERDFVQQNKDTFLTAILKEGGPALYDLHSALLVLIESETGKNGGCANKNRKEAVKGLYMMLLNPSENLIDNPLIVCEREMALLGAAITASNIDVCDISMANTNCLEFIKLPELINLPKRWGKDKDKNQKSYFIACYVNSIREIKTKTGKNKGSKMAFASVSDNTAEINNVVIFPNSWESCKFLFIEGNNIIIVATQGRDNSCIVKQAYQLKFESQDNFEISGPSVDTSSSF